MDVAEIPQELQAVEQVQDEELLEEEQAVDEIPEWFPVAELGERYGLKSPQTILDRRNLLQIRPYKVFGKKVLSREQVESLDALHAHIQTHGSYHGFPIPDPSGPEDEEQGGAIAHIPQEEQVEKVQYRTQSPKNSKGGKLSLDGGRIQSKAVQLAKEELVAANLARKMLENPDMLPAEDLAEVEAIVSVLESRIPRVEPSPEELADQFLAGLVG